MRVVLVVFLFAATVFAATKSPNYQFGYDAYMWYSAERNDSETFVPWYDDYYHNNELSKARKYDNLPYLPRLRKQTDEERLKLKLFRNYAASLRPIFNGSEAVAIIFHLNLIHIVKMDEINQVLELAVWMEMTWLDERLTWNPDEFSGLTMLRIPTSLIWVPDIVLYNNADDLDKRTKAEDVRAMIAKSGEVFLGPYLKLRSTCILDLTLYPYDEQNCQLVFGSWTYDSSQLTLAKKADEIELSQYIDSAKWELIKSSVEIAERRHTCCEAPFADVIITIKMRRRFLFNNLFDLFIPTVVLTLLCLMCFYLPPESGEKIALGITVLLTFTLYTWMIAESTPRTSDFVPLISIYLTITMLLAAVVVALQVFMLNVNSMTPVLRPVPLWLRVIVIDRIAGFLRLENYPKYQEDDTSDLPARQNYCSSVRQHNASTWKEGVYFGKEPPKKKASAFMEARRRLVKLWTRGEKYQVHQAEAASFGRLPGEDFSDSLLDDHFDWLMSEIQSTSRLRFMAREAKFFEQIERIILGENEEPYELLENCYSNDDGPKWGPSNSRKRLPDKESNQVFLKLIQSVTMMAKRERFEGLKHEIASEWRLIALVIDRMAFIFFFAFVIVSTFFLLVWIPLTQEEYPNPKKGFNAPVRIIHE